jgi:succinate-semialdehyde dehydrogenase/glutarate-semialdehyde dehydrogenase
VTTHSANRILVQESVVEDFTERLVAKVQALKMGCGFDEGVTQGPLVNRAATDKVAAHVKDAVERGAKVHIGGSAAATDGFFFEPTVMTGVTSEMQVAKDETFGPLAPIFSFKTEDEAVTMSNDTEFGLASYFFSRDIGRVMRVANKMECGMVGVNTGKISAAETPFGGVLESGFGREGSKYGMAEYMVMKAITIGNTHK